MRLSYRAEPWQQRSDPGEVLEGVTLAVAARFDHPPRRLDWLQEQGFACAWTPDPSRLERLSERLAPYLDRGMAMRHHGYFPGVEIGHEDPRHAEKAVGFHYQVIDAIQGVGEGHLTVHVGLDFELSLNHDRVIENLKRLAEYGRRSGITISLENLRQGPTSDPEILARWAEQSGASITFDIGHAVSCQKVRSGETSVGQFIDRVGPRITEVHCYEFESDHHHAPQNMQVLGPILDRLAPLDCRWWTIELLAIGEILRTRDLIYDHFTANERSHGISLCLSEPEPDI